MLPGDSFDTAPHYQEALALAEREGVDPEEFVAFAPDEHFDAYSYGSELLTHDGAVASLVACAATLHRQRLLAPFADTAGGARILVVEAQGECGAQHRHTR